MVGANRVELESLKAFLSRSDDGTVRLAYRRNAEPMPRMCILVGTADRPDCLPNDNNLRRFVPVLLEGGDPAAACAWMDEHREQCWAEAIDQYRRGVQAWLPRAFAGAQEEATEAARRPDEILEDRVATYLATAPEVFTLAEAAAGAGLYGVHESVRIEPREGQRLAAALRIHGCTPVTHRVAGKRRRSWQLPEPPSDTAPAGSTAENGR